MHNPRSGEEWQVGDRLDQYVLLQRLGGGCCPVFKAWHTRLKRHAAVKILPKKLRSDATAAGRFQRETTAAAVLNHPNFCTTYDAREVDGADILVMEYVDGIDLGRLVDHGGPLTLPDACEAACQIALGLQYADNRALVHRDIKPKNLVLTRDGVVKIVDLGLVLIRNSRCDCASVTGRPLGTAEYAAPEQARDSHAVDIRADLYSVGCLLFKLLTGRPPFGRPEYETADAIARAHAQQPIPPIRKLCSAVPRKLATIIARLLAKEAQERYASGEEAARALQPFTKGGNLAALASRVLDRMQERLVLPIEDPAEFGDD